MFNPINRARFAVRTSSVAAALFAMLVGASPASAGPAPLVRSLGSVQSAGANFLGQPASRDARRVANWTVASGDNAGLPFIIVDKIQAKVFVFDRAGRLRGATSALLGMARKDDNDPGIGDRDLSTLRPDERTTAAGRFVARMGRDLHEDILWIDYDSALALHRVAVGKPSDRRLERLATASPLDKRVSYGCVNVPVRFYEDVVVGAFAATGIVYILPEVKTIEQVFAIPKAAGGEIDEDADSRR